MRINLIVGQYPQQYDGQYMPNVLDAWDEYTMEDNYQGFLEAVGKYEGWVAKGDLEAVRVLAVNVPDEAVLDLFKVPVVDAVVVGEVVVGEEE